MSFKDNIRVLNIWFNSKDRLLRKVHKRRIKEFYDGLCLLQPDYMEEIGEKYGNVNWVDTYQEINKPQT